MSDIEKRVKKFINAKKLAIPMEIDNCDAKELDLIVDGSNNISIKIPKEGSAFEVKADDDDLKDVVKELNKFIKSVPRKLEDILQHIQEIWRKYVEADEDSDGSGGGSDDDDDDDDEDEDISSIEISTPISKEDQVDRKQFVYPSIATPSATQRLISDYVLMRDSNFKELGFTASPKNKNLYIWEVKMIPPEGTDLDKDFQKLKKSKGIEWIELEVMFPSTWPNEPPFVRVIGPRFVFRTGHVTVGGSICMDLLTMSGWKPIYTLDQVILQIRTEMGHGGGRLDIGNNQPYNINEARSNFQRVANDHKWIIPKHENLPWNN